MDLRANILLDILACPVCKKKITVFDEKLRCDNCNIDYQVDDGVPVMLTEIID